MQNDGGENWLNIGAVPFYPPCNGTDVFTKEVMGGWHLLKMCGLENSIDYL